MNYNNRKFRPVLNSDNGEVSSDMIFHYKQLNNILTCTYQGKSILSGHLMGIVDEDGHIQMSYHQVNTKGQLMTGHCRSRPTVLENGKIQLSEEWQWTSGDKSKGHSILEEI